VPRPAGALACRHHTLERLVAGHCLDFLALVSGRAGRCCGRLTGDAAERTGIAIPYTGLARTAASTEAIGVGLAGAAQLDLDREADEYPVRAGRLERQTVPVERALFDAGDRALLSFRGLNAVPLIALATALARPPGGAGLRPEIRDLLILRDQLGKDLDGILQSPHIRSVNAPDLDCMEVGRLCTGLIRFRQILGTPGIPARAASPE